MAGLFGVLGRCLHEGRDHDAADLRVRLHEGDRAVPVWEVRALPGRISCTRGTACSVDPPVFRLKGPCGWPLHEGDVGGGVDLRLGLHEGDGAFRGGYQ